MYITFLSTNFIPFMKSSKKYVEFQTYCNFEHLNKKKFSNFFFILDESFM